MIHFPNSHMARSVALYAIAMVTASLVLASCANRNPTEPAPSQTTTNSTTLDQFYSPGPTGEADDYYIMTDSEDDVEYSYFLDEQDYFAARDAADNANSNPHYIFIREYVKKGHGYGDHNHMHVHMKGGHHYHGIYIGRRRHDWTDSLQLTVVEKRGIDSAMREFMLCAKNAVDSFAAQLKPFRQTFRATKLSILNKLDSGLITRDSARGLLDSAIVTYEAATRLLRQAFITELRVCRTELDVRIRAILTPEQYAIWVRHRGW